MDRGETRFHAGELRGIEFEPLAVVPQHATGFVDTDSCLVDQRDNTVQVLVVRRHLAQPVRERGQA